MPPLEAIDRGEYGYTSMVGRRPTIVRNTGPSEQTTFTPWTKSDVSLLDAGAPGKLGVQPVSQCIQPTTSLHVTGFLNPHCN